MTHAPSTSPRFRSSSIRALVHASRLGVPALLLALTLACATKEGLVLRPPTGEPVVATPELSLFVEAPVRLFVDSPHRRGSEQALVVGEGETELHVLGSYTCTERGRFYADGEPGLYSVQVVLQLRAVSPDGTILGSHADDTTRLDSTVDAACIGGKRAKAYVDEQRREVAKLIGEAQSQLAASAPASSVDASVEPSADPSGEPTAAPDDAE